jgi:ABC-type multidrug transport system ATPase subunit
MATHRLNEVTAVCDRALLLDEGVIKFNGPPSQIISADGVTWLDPDELDRDE